MAKVTAKNHAMPTYVEYERELLEEFKRTPEEFLEGLLKLVRSYRQRSVAKKALLENFERSWQDAQGGKVKPISELWNEIDAE